MSSSTNYNQGNSSAEEQYLREIRDAVLKLPDEIWTRFSRAGNAEGFGTGSGKRDGKSDGIWGGIEKLLDGGGGGGGGDRSGYNQHKTAKFWEGPNDELGLAHPKNLAGYAGAAAVGLMDAMGIDHDWPMEEEPADLSGVRDDDHHTYHNDRLLPPEPPEPLETPEPPDDGGWDSWKVARDTIPLAEPPDPNTIPFALAGDVDTDSVPLATESPAESYGVEPLENHPAVAETQAKDEALYLEDIRVSESGLDPDSGITQEWLEEVANRPVPSPEELASELFADMDTSGSGAAEMMSGSSEDRESKSEDVLEKILEAIQEGNELAEKGNDKSGGPKKITTGTAVSVSTVSNSKSKRKKKKDDEE